MTTTLKIKTTLRIAASGLSLAGALTAGAAQVSWSTYVANPAGSCVAMDADGNVLMAGGFRVTKLGPFGVPLWSTNFNGEVRAIAVDSNQNVLVTGGTSSSNWVSGGYDITYNGGAYDAFVAKLNPAGQLMWSTYLGGTDTDNGLAIAADSADNVLVAGLSWSTNWVSGGYHPWHGVYSDGFVVGLSPAGAHLWSTFLLHAEGNITFDSYDVQGIAIDTDDSILVAGLTRFCQYIEPDLVCIDLGFVTKLWYGTHQWTRELPSPAAYSVAVDASRNIFAAGPGYGPAGSGILTKLNPAGTQLWYTSVGGASNCWPMAVAVDPFTNIVVVGTTRTTNWASGGFDVTYNGGISDAFVAKLTSNGVPLWSSYVGGTQADEGGGVTLDAAGTIYMSGTTYSTNWISGGFDTNSIGNKEGFLVAIRPSASVRVVLEPDESIAAGARWRADNGDWRDSGDTCTIAPDQATIEFTGLRGWTAPCPVTLHWLDGQSGTMTSTYAPAVVELSWTQHLGGTNADTAQGIALDPEGNVLLTGRTASSNWISGGFDTNYAGLTGYLAKLGITGTPLWSTYLKGTQPYGVAADAEGNILVTGDIGSATWIRGGYITNYQGGGRDGFVAKFSPAGAHLWSSYLGGWSGQDVGDSVAVDSAGNIFVLGYTGSSNWLSGGFDPTFNGGYDAFVVKLSAAGAHLWSTYLGGSTLDYGYGLAIDDAGNCWVTGHTSSSNWTSGGYDLNYAGGNDGFVVKLSPAGAHLWSTYLGGNNYDSGKGIAVDADGNAFIAGSTSSSNWVSGGCDTVLNANDVFVVKLSASGAHLWSTYLGGSNSESAYGLALDAAGYALITGSTSSSNWLNGGLAIDAVCDASPSFVAKLAPTGTPVWSSYLPGAMDGLYHDLTTDRAGSVLLAGNASDDIVVTRVQHLVWIREPGLSGGDMRFSIEADGLPDWPMMVEGAAALNETAFWEEETDALLTNTAPGRFSVQVPRENPVRFYRVRGNH